MYNPLFIYGGTGLGKTHLLCSVGHLASALQPQLEIEYLSLDEFVAGAVEHPGSWWPNWLDWLRQQDSTQVAAKGKRVPGGRGDSAIEDAPGRYVKTR